MKRDDVLPCAAVILAAAGALSLVALDAPSSAPSVSPAAAAAPSTSPAPTTHPTWRTSATPAAVSTAATAAKRDGGRPTRRQWRALADCESSNRPRVVSPNGLYFGLYQFDLSTWRGVGGRGLPTKASRREQLKRARILFADRGTQPWPTCGKHLR